jgi:HAD superfamily hydrolase (TIGR01509 family)
MAPKFIYFDLGKVLLCFDRDRQFRQMADVAGITPEKVRELFFDSGLYVAYETGELTTQQVFDEFCTKAGVACDRADLELAANDIFWPNVPMIPVVGALWSAGHRLGILSNTCATHWEFIADGRFRFLTCHFEQATLSYEVGAMKPDAKIYLAAAEKAGVAPNEILFTDDLEENVAGARQAGFDAVHYTSTATFVDELRSRGVEFSY